jgi:hypothetical protein
MTVSLMGVRWRPRVKGHGVIEPSSLKPERKPAPLDMIGLSAKTLFSLIRQ